jgi:hypothetical protein
VNEGVERPDPMELPPIFPVMTCSRVLGMGKDQTYRRIKEGSYPVRLLEENGKYKVSKYDLLAYLHAPGYYQPAPPAKDPGESAVGVSLPRARLRA